MSLDEVAAKLRAVLETIRQQRAALTATMSSIAATRDKLRLLTHGSRHPLVTKLLAAWEATLERLREADLLLAGAAAALFEYAQNIGVNVSSLGPGSASGGDSGTASSHPIPVYIAKAAGHLTHRRKTAGSAFDQHGRPLIGREIISGGELEPGTPPTVSS